MRSSFTMRWSAVGVLDSPPAMMANTSLSSHSPCFLQKTTCNHQRPIPPSFASAKRTPACSSRLLPAHHKPCVPRCHFSKKMCRNIAPTWLRRFTAAKILHHCVELRFSHAQRCQAPKCGTQIHWVRQIVPPIQSYSFLRLPRKRHRCPRRHWFFQRGAVLRIVLLLLISRQDTSMYASVERSQLSVVRSYFGLNVSSFLRDPNCLGPNTSKPICIVLHVLSSVLDSFRPTQPGLAIHFCCGVLTCSGYIQNL